MGKQKPKRHARNVTRGKPKRKMTPAQTRRAKKRAEELKGKPGVRNPHAVARAEVKRKGRKR